MNNLAKSAIAAVFALPVLSAQAQQPFDVLPTEVFACNFVGGSDMSDLNAAFDDGQGLDVLWLPTT